MYCKLVLLLFSILFFVKLLIAQENKKINVEYMGCYENDRRIILSTVMPIDSRIDDIESCYRMVSGRNFNFMAVSKFDLECYAGYTFYPLNFKKSCTCKSCKNESSLMCSNPDVNDYSSAVYRIIYDGDPCINNLCQNKGLCVPYFGNSGYSCTCDSKTTGKNCETFIDVCTKSTCLNGGTCSMVPNNSDYMCTCKDGYFGKNCEKSYLSVNTSLVQYIGCYLGVMSDLFETRELVYYYKNSFQKCFQECFSKNFLYMGIENGYAGCLCGNKTLFKTYSSSQDSCQPCEIDNNLLCPSKNGNYMIVAYNISNAYYKPCSMERCLYGGTCSEDGLSYKCSCLDGFSGNNCQITPCHKAVCQNSGTCFINANKTAECNCPYGFIGEKCEIEVSNCK